MRNKKVHVYPNFFSPLCIIVNYIFVVNCKLYCYIRKYRNCTNEMKAEEKKKYAVRFIEIDFLLPVIGMKLKMCVREIPTCIVYFMNDESCSTLCKLKIKKWRPLALHTDELKRSISLFQAITYGVGLILGAGIYVIIGDVAAIAGNAMWISFILAALIALVTGFSYAELSSIFPKSAAEYVYSKNAFDSNFVGSIAGCMIIFVAIVSAATVAIGFAEYFVRQLYPHNLIQYYLLFS